MNMSTYGFGKRQPLSIETKLGVLEALKYNSKIDVSRKFGIGYSTVKKIKKDEDIILQKVSKTSNLLRKRDRQSPNEEVGNALITWFHQMKMQNIPINGPIMLEKAKELACTLGFDDFKPSHGWLERLKARNNIRFQKAPTRQNTAKNNNEAEEWIKNVLPKIIEEYDPKNVFNAAESALFYKAAPSILTGNDIPNAVPVEERLTLLFFCNATGMEKHVFAIGKESNPPCFNTEATPFPYYCSSNVLMTDFIWQDILQKMDQNLEKQKRKIILFVKDVDCHKTKLKLKNIEIALLPTEDCHKTKLKLKNIEIALLPTDPSLIQPLDRGIIRTAKIYYRSQLVQEMIKVSNKGMPPSVYTKDISLLQVLRMFNKAWSCLKPAMIINCFQKAGFYADDVFCLDDSSDISNEEAELKDLLQEEFEAFIECDTDIDCFENSVDPKVAAITTPNIQELDEPVVIDNEIPRVSHEEALDALSIVRKYLDENFSEYNAYYEIEEMIRLNAYRYANGNNQNNMMDMDSFSFNS